MILLIDNYDSFSYNLFQMCGAIEPDIRVIRNDECSVDEIADLGASGIIISPGPGRPEDAGVCVDLIRYLAGVHQTLSVSDGRNPDISGASGSLESSAVCGAAVREAAMPLLGVCLGHQSICAAFGAEIGYAKKLMHGKASICRLDTSSPLFEGLAEEEMVGRYHSLAAREDSMPDCLRVTARCRDGEIMAVEHVSLPIYGIQFHPESILTPHGGRMLANFVGLCRMNMRGE